MARAPTKRQRAKTTTRVADRQAAAAEKLVAEAASIDAAGKAFIEAAGLVRTLWVSFIFFGLYLTIAAGGITHRQLFLEEPLRLPVINADLPLVAFFWVAPALFVIAHAYLLLQLKLLADRARLYCSLVDGVECSEAVRANLRLHLPSFVFVEYLVHPRHDRRRATAWLVCFIAWFTVAVAPVLLLLVIQLKFLAYQDSLTTWVHRALIGADIVFLYIYWSDVACGLGPKQILTNWRARGAAAGALLAGLFSLFIATFPGEWVNRNPLASALDRVVSLPSYYRGQVVWLPFTEALLSGSVDDRTGERLGLFANYLVLPDEDFVDDKLAAEMMKRDKDTGTQLWEDQRILAIFRGRSFINANLANTDLRYSDFRGADLRGAILDGAKLDGTRLDHATMERAVLDSAHLSGVSLDSADLKGASLSSASLSGATLKQVNLQGAVMDWIHLERASLDGAHLEGASLRSAHLEGASLYRAWFQGAMLDIAKFAGASLWGAHLEGASINIADFSGACVDGMNVQGASLEKAVMWRAQGAPQGFKDALLSLTRPGNREPDTQAPADSARMPRVWRAKGVRVLGRSYVNWFNRMKKAVFEASPDSAGKDVAGCVAGLDADAQSAQNDRSDRKKWSSFAREARKKADFRAFREREWMKLACKPAPTADVAQGIVRNFADSLSPASARRLLAGSDAECPGAEKISDTTREVLRGIVEPAATAPTGSD